VNTQNNILLIESSILKLYCEIIEHKANVDLPVCLSPIISSLCPIAIGNKQSTILNPVAILSKRLDLEIIFGDLQTTKI
jgi:hypothetical protein